MTRYRNLLVVLLLSGIFSCSKQDTVAVTEESGIKVQGSDGQKFTLPKVPRDTSHLLAGNWKLVSGNTQRGVVCYFGQFVFQFLADHSGLKSEQHLSAAEPAIFSMRYSVDSSAVNERGFRRCTIRYASGLVDEVGIQVKEDPEIMIIERQPVQGSLIQDTLWQYYTRMD